MNRIKVIGKIFKRMLKGRLNVAIEEDLICGKGVTAMGV